MSTLSFLLLAFSEQVIGISNVLIKRDNKEYKVHKVHKVWKSLALHFHCRFHFVFFFLLAFSEQVIGISNVPIKVTKSTKCTKCAQSEEIVSFTLSLSL